MSILMLILTTLFAFLGSVLGVVVGVYIIGATAGKNMALRYAPDLPELQELAAKEAATITHQTRPTFNEDEEFDLGFSLTGET